MATDLSSPIPYEGSAQLPVSVSVGCLSVLQNGGEGDVEVTVTDAPGWLTAAPATIPVDESTCVTGGGFASGEGTLGLTVAKDAPGVVDHTINIVASLGATASEPVPVVFTVAYHVNYTIVADARFPLMVNGTEASFNITVTQASNARSMVMIEKASSSIGVFSGVPAVVYDNEAGKPVSKTYKATFKAPDGEWANATATFTGFSHYLLLDGRAGEFGTPCAGATLPVCDAAGTTVTYSFVPGEHEHEDEDKESPAPVGAFVALGLVALAALVRRRA
jgi:MYXO-CTERM domain-containing protein